MRQAQVTCLFLQPCVDLLASLLVIAFCLHVTSMTSHWYCTHVAIVTMIHVICNDSGDVMTYLEKTC